LSQQVTDQQVQLNSLTQEKVDLIAQNTTLNQQVTSLNQEKTTLSQQVTNQQNQMDTLTQEKTILFQHLTDWHWDTNRKASILVLSENNRKVAKPGNVEGYTAVIGNVGMKKGRYIWELHVVAGSPSHWIQFGIVDDQTAKQYENLPYKSTYGITTHGYSVKKDGAALTFSPFSDKTIKCEFDTSQGTFKITDEGIVLYSNENADWKNQTMFPFVTLTYGDSPNGMVMLKSVECIPYFNQ